MTKEKKQNIHSNDENQPSEKKIIKKKPIDKKKKKEPKSAKRDIEPGETTNEEQKGRPRKFDDSKIENIGFHEKISCFIAFTDYFEEIGQRHGLVFNEKEREKLIKVERNFWNETHKWKPEEEQEKIFRTMQMLKEIEAIRSHHHQLPHDDIPKRTQEVLYKFISEISGFFCNEVTQEIYNLIKEIIDIVLEFGLRLREEKEPSESVLEMLKNELLLLGNEMFSEERGKTDFKYLTFQFCNYSKLQIDKKVSQESRHKASAKLVLDLGRQFFCLFMSLNFFNNNGININESNGELDDILDQNSDEEYKLFENTSLEFKINEDSANELIDFDFDYAL